MSVKEKKIMLHFNVCSSTTLHLNYRTQSFPYIQGKTYSPLPLNEFESRAWLSQHHEVSEHLLHFRGAASCIHLLFQPVRCGLPSLQVTTRTFQYYDLYPLIRSFALLALTKVNFLSWYIAFKKMCLSTLYHCLHQSFKLPKQRCSSSNVPHSMIVFVPHWKDSTFFSPLTPAVDTGESLPSSVAYLAATIP